MTLRFGAPGRGVKNTGGWPRPSLALRSRDDDDLSAEALAQAEHEGEFLNFGI